MNIVNTLTLRHIKTHKKRSVLTLLAIIVSVAMVTAVFTSAISFVKYFQNVTLAVDGNWHAKFRDSDFIEHKSVYQNDKNIDEFGLSAFYGMSVPKEGDKTQTSENIFTVDLNWFSMRNVKVSAGRYPNSSKEILVVKDFAEKDEKYAIGNRVTLDIEKDDGEIVSKEFLVVGYTESAVSATDNENIFMGYDGETVKQLDTANVYVRYNKLDNSIWDKADATSRALGDGIDGYSYNTELFTYSGIMKSNSILSSLIGFAGILLLIIAIVSIFMIYDSFAVSYQERAKYLGMLASVGATKKQKRASVYFEGFILGLIGIPVGILSGIGGIAITFECIKAAFMATMAVEYDGTLKVYVNWLVILGTVLASAITIFISSYIPAKKASKTTAIEAIRQTGTLKVKNPKKLRTSKLAGKIFGYEGVLAVKNYKRNGRRSRNIVFSLFLSVVVFLTVMNFSSMFSDVMNTEFSSTVDCSVGVPREKRELLFNAVEQESGIDDCYMTIIETAKIDPALFKDGEESKIGYGNNNELNCEILFMDNASFDSYLNQLGENTEKYHNQDSPAAVLLDLAYRRDNGKSVKSSPVTNVQNTVITAQVQTGFDDDNNTPIYSDAAFRIGKQTAEAWNNPTCSLQYTAHPVFIMSMDFADKFFTQSYTRAQAYINCSDPDAVVENIGNRITEADPSIEIQFSELNNSMEAINNILKITKVFIYGFITLITIISIMNIINTISNSMNERRREFAMIRSVGMTPKSFKKMIYLESFRYGAKSLVFSIPVSVAIHFLMYKALANSFDYGFKLHIMPYLIAVVAVFLIIESALFYSIDRIKDDNIIDTLKTDVG